jgi:creatinine amidohydrolase
MKWENLTSLDFEKEAKNCNGVGILPIGVLEAHASHLPLGSDMLAAHAIATAAAKEEPAIVFPAYPFGINAESAHLPGSLVLQLDLLFTLLENICDEMARNGLNKIILYSEHGGNRYYLPQFVQMLPAKRKNYLVYYADLPFYPNAEEILDTDEYGHAGEAETSLMLHLAPQTVKMEQLPSQPFTNLKRNEKLRKAGAYSQMDWFSQYPHLYVGDAHTATAAKGKLLFDYSVTALIKLIRTVKDDTTTPALLAEFNRRTASPKSPDFWTS